MADIPTPHVALELAFAVVESSAAPLLLIDGDMRLLAASDSFYHIFDLPRADSIGQFVFALDGGRWDMSRLRSALAASLTAQTAINAYELDLPSQDHGKRRLVIKAQRLDYLEDGAVRILISIADVTDARLAEKLTGDLLREKTVLLKELQHRIANSLQIIASVLMQSALKVQSKEAKHHLQNAHHRVMTIASVQQQLAASDSDVVRLRPYLTQLCRSIGASMIHDPKQLTLMVRSDNATVPSNISVSLGLIVTELVINALKHGFPDGQAGQIDVDYSARAGNWTLAVSDNGIGMPVAPDIAVSGLGSSIIEALAKQLHATVSVADNCPGTAVSITHTKVSLASGDREKMRDTEAV